MKDWKNIDPREVLRRLDEFLDDDLPTDEDPATEVDLPTEEEARVICAEMGIDIPAVTARILAMVDAHEAGLSPLAPLPLNEEPPPRSHVAVRPTRASSLRSRTRH